MEIVNWNIARHPMNWVTVFMMVFIAGLATHFVLSYVKGQQAPK